MTHARYFLYSYTYGFIQTNIIMAPEMELQKARLKQAGSRVFECKPVNLDIIL